MRQRSLQDPHCSRRRFKLRTRLLVISILPRGTCIETLMSDCVKQCATLAKTDRFQRKQQGWFLSSSPIMLQMRNGARI